MNKNRGILLAKTVQKAFVVLEYLAFSKQPIKVKNIAEACNLSRPTAYRLVATLQHCGYVNNSVNGAYSLSTKILKLSRMVLDNLDLRVLAKPILRNLRSITGETSILAIQEGKEIFYIGNFESTNSVSMNSRVGTNDPLHNTAPGKVILAFLPEEVRSCILEHLDLKKFTENTITNHSDFLIELKKIRKLGFAIEDRENNEDIRCISSPIFDHMGKVIGALGTSGPAYRFDLQKMNEIAPMVVRAAKNLSRLLGYSSETGEGNSLNNK